MSNITDYPLCNARGLLQVVAFGGHGPGESRSEFRVQLYPLLMSFTPAERVAWDRCTTIGPKDRDEHGLFAASIEVFLKTLTRLRVPAASQPTEESPVATATATKKKPAKKKPASKKPATSEKTGKPLRTTADEQKEIDAKAVKDGVTVSKGNAKYDADQKVIDGMEDEKIPALDACIKRILANERIVENTKSAIEVDVARLEPLMKQHGVDDYAAHGIQLVRVLGTPKVLRKRIKDK